MSLSILEKEDRFDTSPISIGTLIYSPLTTPPTGTIPTDGAYYDPNSAEYKDLFYIIGYRFGKRTADSFFRVPNISSEYHLRAPNTLLFNTAGNTVMSHSHGAVASSLDGAHTHDFYLERYFANVNNRTSMAEGTGTATTAGVTATLSLSSTGLHNHDSVSVNYSGGTTQPPNVGMFLYIVYRRM
jgi:hypothetical protein